MTPAEHAELSAQLARALGWEHVYPACDKVPPYWKKPHILVSKWIPSRGRMMTWRIFDYRDPSVAMGVLEWLMREQGVSVCFDDEYGQYEIERYGTPRYFDTLPEAIARAAIAVADAKRRHLEQNEAREVLQA